MGTSFISVLFVGITVLIVFMILLVVMLFVGVGAYRLIAARKDLNAIDLSDGLDESEIQIIRNALLKKQTADKEAKVIICEASGPDGNEVTDESKIQVTVQYIDETLKPAAAKGAVTGAAKTSAPVKKEDL